MVLRVGGRACAGKRAHVYARSQHELPCEGARSRPYPCPCAGAVRQMKLAERPIPWPRAGELLVRVRAFGACGQDLLQRRARYVAPTAASDILGLEVAGEVVATGPDVTAWQEGDYVCCFLPGGGYAEFCTAEATQCWPIPKGLGWEMAAALPVCLCTRCVCARARACMCVRMSLLACTPVCLRAFLCVRVCTRMCASLCVMITIVCT